MAIIKIDGREYEFEPGQQVLQFCLDSGIEIPHFCYHPALSVPANCRQCYVRTGTPAIDRASGQPELDAEGNPKINWMPKMMPSCALDMTDGMVVETQISNPDVAQAQEDTMELLLINHPLDCPICDQAGHCPLQIQAYKYGSEGSRFEFQKVHKPKRVRLGPNVILDAERCINCTRCTRFTEEVSESHQLTIINRGDKNYPMTAPGVQFDEAYSMNVCDLCPVGALTESYFRFQARPWEMSSVPSISDFGGKGINVTFWVRDNKVIRITPRQNPDVNEFWMPDAARLVFNRYNDERPDGPALRNDDGEWSAASWKDAYDSAALMLKRAGASEIVFLGSAYATVEDNYLLMKLAEALGAEAPSYIAHHEDGSGDEWLISDDPAPNTQGCERLGMNAVDPQTFAARVRAAKVLYVLDDDPVAAGVLLAEDLADVSVILHHYHSTNQTLPFAAISLPAAMVVETAGTYVNLDGRAQRVRPVKAIRGSHRSLMLETGKSRLERQGTPFDRWFNEENQVDCRPGWLILPEVAERLAQPMRYAGPEAIMKEIAAEPAFAGATPDAMGLQGVALQDVGAAV
ncbi:2Fe-2S iron-sulfur cluster-binding protein [soil metagenome]